MSDHSSENYLDNLLNSVDGTGMNESEQKIQEEFEKTMAQLKQSHVDEIRALAMGHTTLNTDSNNNDNDDEDEEDKMVARITERLKKRYR